jgi:hypothetical protein
MICKDRVLLQLRMLHHRELFCASACVFFPVLAGSQTTAQAQLEKMREGSRLLDTALASEVRMHFALGNVVL